MFDAKAFLQQVKLYDAHIHNKLEEIARLDALATKITSTLKPDVVSGGGNHDKVGDVASAIADLKDEYYQTVFAYKKLKKQVENVLAQMDDPDEIDVLYKLYFFRESWEQIATEMHMTARNAQKIHGSALVSVRKILENESVRKSS